MIDESDDEFESVTVAEVDACTDGWSIKRSDGWTLFTTNENCSVAPSVGEEMRCYGRGIGFPVRGITIGGRVYRYETPTEHEDSQSRMRQRLADERVESERKFREELPGLPDLPGFALKDEAGWLQCVKMNSQDPYSYACVEYAAKWANLMETRGELNSAGLASADAALRVVSIAEQASREADTSGITGFMYGAAVLMLAKFWAYGDALRRWHNKETQIGTEGDAANESGGVLNPALLSIGAADG